MNTRFYNARILPMQESIEIIEGELWVEGHTITHIGAPKENGPIWNREIDLHGNLLMPTFKNAHTHSAMTFLRSFADDKPLQDWLETQVFPMEAKLTADDVYWLTKLAILEYVSSGIGACFDMYLFPQAIAQACIDTGFRVVLVSGLNDFSSSLEEVDSQYLHFNHLHPLVSYQLGFHAEYTNSRTNLEGVAALAHKYKAPVFTHNSETKSEVDGCLARYGQTPTAFLDSLGIFDYGGGGYHCVHMSQEDLEIFKSRQLWAISNPGSNTKLASGIAPISKMIEMGIPLALGTDGPASNNCLDMFRELFLVTGLAKLREANASAMPAEIALAMATSGSASAMGLSNCDHLAVGKEADLLVIDLMQPNMQPINNIPKNLVYSGSKQNVALTMIAGQILYEKGTFFVDCSVQEIYEHANAIIKHMTNI